MADISLSMASTAGSKGRLGDVRLVVSNGCSFTYGKCLQDPTVSAWGRVLADAIGADFVNLAAGGGSSRRVVRTTVEQLPRLAETRQCDPSEVLYVVIWPELPRWEVLDPANPDLNMQSTAFVDEPWHRIGIWGLDLKYKPAIHYYRYLHHEDGDLLTFLVDYALVDRFLAGLGFHYGFALVEDFLPADVGWSPRFESHRRQIDERRLLGGWTGSGDNSFIEAIKHHNLPMSGRPKGVPRGNGHPLEGAHEAYARGYLLPFAERLVALRPRASIPARVRDEVGAGRRAPTTAAAEGRASPAAARSPSP